MQPDVSARLYENTTFRNNSISIIPIAVNSTVAGVALLLSKPATAVVALFKIVGGVIINATQAHRHDVTVVYQRQARASGFGINNFAWIDEFCNIRFEVTLGDLSDNSRQTTSSMTSNFNNQTTMMQNAIVLHRIAFSGPV